MGIAVYIIIALIVFATFAVTAGVIAFSMAFCRAPFKIGFLNKADSKPSQWEEWRDKIDAAVEKLKNIHSEQWQIISFDGLKLCATFIPCENAKRTILCVHGYRSSGYFDFSMAVGYFLENNCNLLIIDQRAHGRSEGRIITFGVKERYDVRDWSEYLAERVGKDMPIYLDGVSMGCATVLMASALDLSPSVKGIIADCGYSSCYDIIRKVAKEDFGIPAWMIFPIVNLMFRINSGHFMNGIKVYEEVKRTKIPVVFAHGKSDGFVPFEMTVKNYEACMSPKWLLLADDAEHGMSFLKASDEYKRLVSQLFDECEK